MSSPGSLDRIVVSLNPRRVAAAARGPAISGNSERRAVALEALRTPLHRTSARAAIQRESEQVFLSSAEERAGAACYRGESGGAR